MSKTRLGLHIPERVMETTALVGGMHHLKFTRACNTSDHFTDSVLILNNY
jgi:hypothetical protein